MKRLACLLFLGAALAVPALAKVTGVPDTVAVVTPPASTVRASGGCTPINPCAVATPAASEVALPTPEAPPQPQDTAAAPAAAPATPPAAAPRAASAQANCPPGPGAFAGRGTGRGPGNGQGFRGGRGDFAARGGAGRGTGGQAGRGQQFAQNFQGAGRGQGGRGPDGCPPAGRGGNQGR